MQTVLSKQIFLDHNSTTEMEQSAKDALLFFLSPNAPFGNPSSIHWAGREAKRQVEDAREKIALSLGVSDPNSILFTASATEATNMALQGFYFHESASKEVHFISSPVEHEATLKTLEYLEQKGAHLHWLNVDKNGLINLSNLEELLTTLTSNKNNAVMLSLIVANNETGVISPWEKALDLSQKFSISVHLDAVQAWGKVQNFKIPEAKSNAVSLSGHKVGAPKGIGILWLKRGQKLSRLIHGGAQERQRRAGTLNVPYICALAAAAASLQSRNLAEIKNLRDKLELGLKKRIDGVQILGQDVDRLGNTTNALFAGVRGEGLVMGLDMQGFAVSSGSACNSGSINPSHVLLAMGFDRIAAASAMRVSLGASTTIENIEDFLTACEQVVGRIRSRKS